MLGCKCLKVWLKTDEIAKKIIIHFIVAPYVIRSILKQIAQEFRHTWLDKTVFLAKVFQLSVAHRMIFEKKRIFTIFFIKPD